MLVKEMFYNVSLFITFFVILIFNASASEKDKIIENLKNTENFDFKFEQNINGKIENGHCTIEYPKKIFCEYARSNNKILILLLYRQLEKIEFSKKIYLKFHPKTKYLKFLF